MENSASEENGKYFTNCNNHDFENVRKKKNRISVLVKLQRGIIESFFFLVKPFLCSIHFIVLLWLPWKSMTITHKASYSVFIY